MKLGFTGTRHGMSSEQFRAVIARIQQLDVTEFHHGCCRGADIDAFEIVEEYAHTAHKVAHPPEKRGLISHEAEMFSDEVRPARPYLQRNFDIAEACDHLFATPAESEEQPTGGTWHTVRAARRLRRPVTIFWPDGTTTDERPEDRR